MDNERRENNDRRQQDRRSLIRRGEGGWRLRPDGRRATERRSEPRRIEA